MLKRATVTAAFLIISAFFLSQCKVRQTQLASTDSDAEASRFIPVVAYDRGQLSDADFSRLLEALTRAVQNGTAAALLHADNQKSDVGSAAALLLYAIKQIDDEIGKELGQLPITNIDNHLRLELLFVDRKTPLKRTDNPVLEDMRAAIMSLFWMSAKLSGSAGTGQSMERAFALAEEAVIVDSRDAPYREAAAAYKILASEKQFAWLPVFLQLDLKQTAKKWRLQSDARIIPANIVAGLIGFNNRNSQSGFRLTTFDYTAAGGLPPDHGAATIALRYSQDYADPNNSRDIYVEFGDLRDDIRTFHNCGQNKKGKSCLPDTKRVGWRSPTFNGFLDPTFLPALVPKTVKANLEQICKVLGTKRFVHIIVNRLSFEYQGTHSFNLRAKDSDVAVIFGRGSDILQVDHSSIMFGVNIYQRLFATNITSGMTSGMKALLVENDVQAVSEIMATMKPLASLFSVASHVDQ